MNYLYLGLGDLYLPAAAAAMHLGRLDQHADGAFESVTHFRHGEKHDDGEPHFIGQDQSGNQIYVMCVKEHSEVIEHALMSLLSVNGIDRNEIKVRPCLPENPQVVMLSKLLGALGLDGLRHMLGCRLVKNRMPDLVKISGNDSRQALPH